MLQRAPETDLDRIVGRLTGSRFHWYSVTVLNFFRKRSKTIRRLALNLAIIIVACLIALTALEMASRWILPLWPDPISDYDPELGFSHVPGATGWWVSIINPLEFRTRVSINAHGLREREITLEKPDGYARVLVLGDSVTNALEVPLEATYVKQLESRLRHAAYQVEVINGGHYGYGTDQELVFYELRGRAFQPDLVILAFYPGNDLLDNASAHTLGAKPFFEFDDDGSLALRNFPVPPPEVIRILPDPVSWFKSVLHKHSRLYQFAVYQSRQHLGSITRALRDSEEEAGAGTPQPRVYNETPDRQLEQSWDLTQSIILRLKDEVEKDGAVLAIAIMPDRRQFLLAEWEAPVNATIWNERLIGFCSVQALDCLDLYPVFLEQLIQEDPVPLFYQFDIHPTTAGHRVIGGALYDFLIDSGLSERLMPME